MQNYFYKRIERTKSVIRYDSVYKLGDYLELCVIDLCNNDNEQMLNVIMNEMFRNKSKVTNLGDEIKF